VDSLAVKFISSDAAAFVIMGMIGTFVAIINGFIKEVAQKFFARRELKRNPLCFVGARLLEFRDGSNRVLLADCEVTDIAYGRVILTQWKDPKAAPDTAEPTKRMSLTCREYKAGYAIYKV